MTALTRFPLLSRRTRLALLKDINTRVAAEAKISPDDLMITIYEAPAVNFSLGQGEAQRANAVVRSGAATFEALPDPVFRMQTPPNSSPSSSPQP